MKEEYDCDENFEDTFVQMMEEAITAWDETLKKDEDKS
jgi:hypothetical protein